MVLATVSLFIASLAGLPQPGGDPLAGPKVREAPAALRFGLGGELRRTTLRPEESAIRGLPLDAAGREAVDRVLAARGRLLVRFITGHLDLLNRLNVSGSAGDKLGAASLLLEALGRLEAMGFRGDVTAQVRSALPERVRGEFDRRMADYWAAVAVEKWGKPRGSLTVGEVYAARVEESGRVLGQELEAAFQRAERSGELAVAYLLGDLDLSEAQRRRVDEMVGARLDAAGGDLSEEERNRLFLGVMAYLTAEQQERLMRKVRGR